MKFESTNLADVRLIRSEAHVDDRGWFHRTFDRAAFADLGLHTEFPHHNLSGNRTAGTLRGMHYQVPPRSEVKVVQAVVGAVYDVVVDLRPSSPTHRRWQAFELDSPVLLLYVPEGFAHGYQALVDGSVVSYLMGDVYSPRHERGLRWNDPALGIDWPLPVTTSDKDASYPDVDWSAVWSNTMSL